MFVGSMVGLPVVGSLDGAPVGFVGFEVGPVGETVGEVGFDVGSSVG